MHYSDELQQQITLLSEQLLKVAGKTDIDHDAAR